MLKIGEQVYDTRNYKHPGGATILRALDGKDATASFYRFHSLKTLSKMAPILHSLAPERPQAQFVGVNPTIVSDGLKLKSLLGKASKISYHGLIELGILLGILIAARGYPTIVGAVVALLMYRTVNAGIHSSLSRIPWVNETVARLGAIPACLDYDALLQCAVGGAVVMEPASLLRGWLSCPRSILGLFGRMASLGVVTYWGSNAMGYMAGMLVMLLPAWLILAHHYYVPFAEQLYPGIGDGELRDKYPTLHTDHYKQARKRLTEP